MRYRRGDIVNVHGFRPVFDDDGLAFVSYKRQAKFIAYDPKPWDDTLCIIDYGVGKRKCTTLYLSMYRKNESRRSNLVHTIKQHIKTLNRFGKPKIGA